MHLPSQLLSLPPPLHLYALHPQALYFDVLLSSACGVLTAQERGVLAWALQTGAPAAPGGYRQRFQSSTEKRLAYDTATALEALVCAGWDVGGDGQRVGGGGGHDTAMATARWFSTPWGSLNAKF